MTKDSRPSGSAGNSSGGDQPQPIRSKGFLPIETNAWDRIFISVVLFVAISLLWMRFLEQHASINIATAISLILAVFIIWKG